MSLELRFLVDDGVLINDLAGSGLGFYGAAGFGYAVDVSSYQGRTFVTDSTGTSLGPEANNVKFLNPQSGVLGQEGSGVGLWAIPNRQATLAIECRNDSAIQVNNVRLKIYDRVDPDNAPSGITVKLAEIIHPDPSQSPNGSGDTVWTTAAGSGSWLDLAPNPGVSGLYAGNGSNSTRPDVVHRWHVAASVAPNSIGSKSFAGWVELEYQ